MALCRRYSQGAQVCESAPAGGYRSQWQAAGTHTRGEYFLLFPNKYLGKRLYLLLDLGKSLIILKLKLFFPL